MKIQEQDLLTEKLAFYLQNNYPIENITHVIEAGADVNGKIYDLPFISKAIISNFEESIVKLLLQAGANVDESDEEFMTPLMHALLRGPSYQNITNLLLPKTKNYTATDDLNRSYIWYAASWANSELLTFFYNQGIPIVAHDDDLKTPLIHAAENANFEAVEWLIEHGASSIAIDKGGMSALMHAAFYDADSNRRKQIWDNPSAQLFTIQRLLDAGAEIDKTDFTGTTALMYATYVNAIDVVKILIKSGASLTIKNANGEMALDIAPNFQHKELIAIFSDHKNN